MSEVLYMPLDINLDVSFDLIAFCTSHFVLKQSICTYVWRDSRLDLRSPVLVVGQGKQR